MFLTKKIEFKEQVSQIIGQYVVDPLVSFRKIKKTVNEINDYDFELTYSSTDYKTSRLFLKELAFYRIIGFEKNYLEHDFKAAKELLLNVAGSRSLIINDKKTLNRYPFLRNVKWNKYFDVVFSSEPIRNKNWYWHGSNVFCLMDCWPELNLNLFDFQKLPRFPEMIFDENFSKRHRYAFYGKQFVLDQAKKYANLNSNEEAIVFIVNFRKAAVSVRTHKNRTTNGDVDSLFSESEYKNALRYVFKKHGDIYKFHRYIKLNISQ